MLWLATMTGHSQSYTLDLGTKPDKINDLGALATSTVTLVQLVDNSTVGYQTALKVAPMRHFPARFLPSFPAVLSDSGTSHIPEHGPSDGTFSFFKVALPFTVKAMLPVYSPGCSHGARVRLLNPLNNFAIPCIEDLNRSNPPDPITRVNPFVYHFTNKTLTD